MRAPEVLAALPDVARLTVHAGQVLFYPRHTPPGIFVVCSGVVCRFADGTLPDALCGDRLDAASGAFAVPAPDELREPAKAGVKAVTDVEILFVPRSVVLSGTDVACTLAAAGIAVVSLGEHAAGSSPTTATRRRAR
jgi:CRP-like cAMP-binding protein